MDHTEKKTGAGAGWSSRTVCRAADVWPLIAVVRSCRACWDWLRGRGAARTISLGWLPMSTHPKASWVRSPRDSKPGFRTRFAHGALPPERLQSSPLRVCRSATACCRDSCRDVWDAVLSARLRFPVRVSLAWRRRKFLSPQYVGLTVSFAGL